MSETRFTTSQYVCIRQQSATLLSRITAWIIDMVVIMVYTFFMYTITSLMQFSSPVTAVILGTLLMLPAMAYPLLCEHFLHGQSLGKMVMSIRVMSIDGTPPSGAQLLLRWLLLIIDGPVMGCIGILSIIFTKNSQRLGDLAAGTTVVCKHGFNSLHRLLNEYDYLRPDYRLTFPQVTMLSWRQVEVIHRTLYSTDTRRNSQLTLLSQKVQHLLGCQHGMTPEMFLFVVVNDYRHLTASSR